MALINNNPADPAKTVDFNRLVKSPQLLAAFGFGAGLSPRAPGTVGTLLAMVLFCGLGQASLSSYLIVVAIAFVLGVYLCESATKILGVHDHSGIVWDEIVGYWITMMALPVSWPWMLAGFLLFRLFDIWKPWPISWVDKRVQGGFGIMIDDVLAGLVSWAILMMVYQWSGIG